MVDYVYIKHNGIVYLAMDGRFYEVVKVQEEEYQTLKIKAPVLSQEITTLHTTLHAELKIKYNKYFRKEKLNRVLGGDE